MTMAQTFSNVSILQLVHTFERNSRPTDNRFLKEARGSLTITNVMLEDDGKWQCEAENANGYIENGRPIQLVVLGNIYDEDDDDDAHIHVAFFLCTNFPYYSISSCVVGIAPSDARLPSFKPSTRTKYKFSKYKISFSIRRYSVSVVCM